MAFPPPSGFTQLIEVYRGVEIWYNPTSPRYWCKPTSGYVSFEYTLQGCRDYIDWVLGAALFPPPTGFTQLIETYRGVEIWYNPTSPRYWCQPTSGYMSFEYTVQGCRDYIDWVLGPTLSATLSASPSIGSVPLAVTFTIGITGGVTPYAWTLDYGDATTPDSGTVAGTKAHTYTKIGTFTATLTVTDALGASIVYRSKVMAGVIIQSWVSVLAPLAVGAALLKIVGR